MAILDNVYTKLPFLGAILWLATLCVLQKLRYKEIVRREALRFKELKESKEIIYGLEARLATASLHFDGDHVSRIITRFETDNNYPLNYPLNHSIGLPRSDSIVYTIEDGKSPDEGPTVIDRILADDP